MKKLLIALSVAFLCGKAFCGQVGLPTERLALPEVTSGSYLVCIWDEQSGQWFQSFETYDHAGTYDFQVPSWNRWYWVGLWDETSGQYVYGKWVGHFLTN